MIAPTSEEFYILCGPKFGLENIGNRAIFKRALYGVKSSGKYFRSHLRDCMDSLGYSSYKSGPDLWISLSRCDSGEEYYEYMLRYIDDCMCVSEHPKEDF